MSQTSFIIHLARATMRKSNVERLAGTAPGDVCVVDAVDAEGLTGGVIAEWTGKTGRFPWYPFELRKSEIACFLSHRKVWEMIVESGEPGAFVFEDDVVLDSAEFEKARGLVLRYAEPHHFIRFPCVRREAPGMVIASEQDTHLFRPAVIGLGMQAQYVGRDAAARLLDTTRPFDRPVDTTLQMTWMTGQPAYSVWPSGVSEISSDIGGSMIGSRKSVFERGYRELARPLYRVALWLTSRSKEG
ncbi:MAG: glycosyl transferase [Nocardioides sp.]|nr:glycosyl transferase [Nocardioides sp.]|tara:strand:- start:1260 stop:1991 length:732 start_codon:yes stop_codon:yes gene_type:complete